MSEKLAWQDIEKKLVKEKKQTLVALLQNLYQISPDAQLFLHARYKERQPTRQRIASYKRVIQQQFVFHGEIPPEADFSKVQKAISDYRLSSHDEEGVAELCVIALEATADFIHRFHVKGPGFYAEVGELVQTAVQQFEAQPQLYPKYSRRLCQARDKVVTMDMDSADMLDDLNFTLADRQ
ncbi:MAG: hypothetical protein IT327_32580 [Anaerolineae bacterium]|nr:hypothetical protein [Anaerolineae bacterium]